MFRRLLSTQPTLASSTNKYVIGAIGASALLGYGYFYTTQKNLYAPAKPTVVFVLGGAGVGKGTQCTNLVNYYGFTHLSAGDLLRKEVETKDSPYGKLIAEHIKEGAIVPYQITISLLQRAMEQSTYQKFLIDGFPRAMDQAEQFEQQYVFIGRFDQKVLYYACPEEEMLKRLLKRSETSGRTDDNAATIAKRFKVFTTQSMPVIEHFKSKGKVATLSCENTPEKVFEETKKVMDAFLK